MGRSRAPPLRLGSIAGSEPSAHSPACTTRWKRWMTARIAALSDRSGVRLPRGVRPRCALGSLPGAAGEQQCRDQRDADGNGVGATMGASLPGGSCVVRSPVYRRQRPRGPARCRSAPTRRADRGVRHRATVVDLTDIQLREGMKRAMARQGRGRAREARQDPPPSGRPSRPASWPAHPT
jgi:hypothetical protein